MTANIRNFQYLARGPCIVFWFQVQSHAFRHTNHVFGIANVTLAGIEYNTYENKIWIESTKSRQ